jgi:hypothetical protein
MTQRTKILGYQTGASSDKGLSPSQPYTGDGRTTRKPHDQVQVKFKKATDK